MEKKVKKEIKAGTSIKIDYDNLDVADIMDQIKRKIASQGETPIREEPSVGEYRTVTPSQVQEKLGMEGEQVSGWREKLRWIASKFINPLAPFIKLIVLPVHEEVVRTAQGLHQTNLRLDDELFKAVEYTKLLHNLCHNLVVELSKLKIEEENLKSKTRILEKDFEFLKKREKALEELLLR
ncbi:MAG: hypothetical protein GTO17_13805 [Candidatus Aminicenantes bacterium]|nr:hypothetical protein [Candidatus Aminicenantes bacterium]